MSSKEAIGSPQENPWRNIPKYLHPHSQLSKITLANILGTLYRCAARSGVQQPPKRENRFCPAKQCVIRGVVRFSLPIDGTVKSFATTNAQPVRSGLRSLQSVFTSDIYLALFILILLWTWMIFCDPLIISTKVLKRNCPLLRSYSPLPWEIFPDSM